MKIPCEIVVWYMLPTIRKGVAKELVEVHGLTQSKVARLFGVTDAAVSQYLRNKRGDYDVVVNSPGFPMVQEEMAAAASRMVNSGTEFTDEVCNICMVAKSCGIIGKIYEIELGEPMPECDCGGQISIKSE